MPIQQIYNFRQISPFLATAGQPRAEELPLLRAAGIKAVLNLALPASDNAVAGEAAHIASMGMIYANIPVDFGAPTASDFNAFCRLMNAYDGVPLFVHCAANYRVSSFVFLHRVLRLGHADDLARVDLDAIWEPNETWHHFIETTLQRERS